MLVEGLDTFLLQVKLDTGVDTKEDTKGLERSEPVEDLLSLSVEKLLSVDRPKITLQNITAISGFETTTGSGSGSGLTTESSVLHRCKVCYV